MSSYEYTAIPAPIRGEKTRGAKSGIDRFAATMTDTLNQMAQDGWDYVRAETLPAEERSGLTSRSTVYHNLLIFRRALAGQPAQPQPTAAQTADAQPANPQMPEAPPVQAEAPAPARGPFSQPMLAAPKPQAPAAPGSQNRARAAEPPLSAPPSPAPAGPRLGPASR
ncbi:hypothetical protein SAMN05421641_101158 [Paracoccus thiocyanatus]|uniref:DUF4177 domain-containing protein n=1 Tax=Paracoccus thiocyanatus TaxID=34006 RepID=A0A1N6N7D4_9RHOB|nr:DUF4177 domain-containing protein [Paracoccus thiocyanatus]SIP87969.1 hypothetical protein SAMN05421641_101158 [Paracoccus thiocyanatus]